MLFDNSEFEPGCMKVTNWFTISLICFKNCIQIVLLRQRELKIFMYVLTVGSSPYQKHVCFDLTIDNVCHRPVKNAHVTSLELFEVLKYILIILSLRWCWSIYVLKIKLVVLILRYSNWLTKLAHWSTCTICVYIGNRVETDPSSNWIFHCMYKQISLLS